MIDHYLLAPFSPFFKITIILMVGRMILSRFRFYIGITVISSISKRFRMVRNLIFLRIIWLFWPLFTYSGTAARFALASCLLTSSPRQLPQLHQRVK